MSGDVTYQALERLSHMPDNPDNPADAIAGQKYYDVAFTGGAISGVTISGLDVPLAIADGGTGQTTANTALNALLPSQGGNSGKVLKTDGTNTSWSTDTDTGITQLTGDVTAGPGSGSQAATLATVNSNVGSFGSSTSIPSFTVNGKGLITAASGNSVVAPAGTLSGNTLAAGVTASSLTSVGTLTGGATGAGFTIALGTSTVTGTLPVNRGGTGQASLTANNVILGNGTSAVQFVAPGTSGNVLTSNGTTWSSSAITQGNLTGDVTSVGLATTIKSSVSLAGNPTTTTQSSGDASTKIATTAFVNPGSSIGANGYTILPNGIYIQWGHATTTATTVNFPIAFPNNAFSVAFTANVSGGDTTYINVTSLTTSGFTTALGANRYWIAIGN